MRLEAEPLPASVVAAKDQLAAAQARLDAARARPWWRAWRERCVAYDELHELRLRILRSL